MQHATNRITISFVRIYPALFRLIPWFPTFCVLRGRQQMSIVAEAVSNAFGAEKMNYELLGNGDTHLHWHLFPRKSGDIENYGNNGKGPVWWYPMEKMYNDNNRPSKTELEDMKEKLLIELEKLL